MWFLPYITVINALFLCTDPLNLCDFCMRIEVQVTSLNIQWCIWAIQMLLKNFHSTKWTKIPWPYQNRSGVHISWRVHITWIYPILSVNKTWVVFVWITARIRIFMTISLAAELTVIVRNRFENVWFTLMPHIGYMPECIDLFHEGKGQKRK